MAILFRDAGRNIVRGPGITNVDLSPMKTAAIAEAARLQFRAECFNVVILESGPPRLLQFGLKLIY